jgi:hypothetical protein
MVVKSVAVLKGDDLECWSVGTDTRVAPQDQAKAEVRGGRKGLSRPYGLPSFLPGERALGEAMAPMLNEASALLTPRNTGGIDRSLDKAPEDLLAYLTSFAKGMISYSHWWELNKDC